MEQLGIHTNKSSRRNLSPSAPTGRLGGVLLLSLPLVILAVCFLVFMGHGPATAAKSALHILYLMLLGYIFLAGLLRFGQMILSMLQIRVYYLGRQLGRGWTLPPSERVPPISLLVWVHNQAPTVTEQLNQLLNLEYPTFEIIVVNDGSSDKTQNVLQAAFELQPVNRVFRRVLPTHSDGTLFVSAQYPNLIVVEKPWSGWGDSLNLALNIAQYPFVCTLDPDLVLQHHALARLAKSVIEDLNRSTAVLSLAGFSDEVDSNKDPNLMSPSQSMNQSNDYTQSFESATWVENLQRVDRLGLFHSSWAARNWLASVPITGGILLLLKKSEAIAAGGYDPYVEGGSLKLLLHMQNQHKEDQPSRVVFLPDVLARIDISDNLGLLAQTQQSWQRQTVDAVLTHWKLLTNPNLVGIEKMAYPVFLLIDVLGPVIELFAFFTVLVAGLVGATSWPEVFLFVLAMMTFAFIQSVGGVLCEEFSRRTTRRPRELIQLILAGFSHAFGYRQLSAWWKVRGMIDYTLGR